MRKSIAAALCCVGFAVVANSPAEATRLINRYSMDFAGDTGTSDGPQRLAYSGSVKFSILWEGHPDDIEDPNGPWSWNGNIRKDYRIKSRFDLDGVVWTEKDGMWKKTGIGEERSDTNVTKNAFPSLDYFHVVFSNYLRRRDGRELNVSYEGVVTYDPDYLYFGRVNALNGREGENIELLSSRAVPEPATWAMMILGFGLTGAAIRRTKFGSMASKAII